MLELSIAHYEAAAEAEKMAIASDIHASFIAGEPLRITEYEAAHGAPRIADQLGWLSNLLATLREERGFVGIDGVAVQRRSFCLINQFDRPAVDLDYIEQQAGLCDADPESLRLGAELANQLPKLREYVERNNRALNRVIANVMDILRRNLRLPPGYFRREILEGSTYRQRYISYGRGLESNSCGVHPDGNLFSFLITDRPGFRYFDAEYQVHEPPADGIICLVGSLLWRWTAGLYPPVFHYVRRFEQEQKTSIVYLYNLEDQKQFRQVPHARRAGWYVNDVRKHKLEDLNPRGPFAADIARLSACVSYD